MTGQIFQGVVGSRVARARCKWAPDQSARRCHVNTLKVFSDSPVARSFPAKTSHSPPFPSRLSPYAQPFVPSGLYMERITITSCVPMSFRGPSYTGSPGPGTGLSISPQYGPRINYVGASAWSAGVTGVKGMPLALTPRQRHHVHLGVQQRPMNSFGNMASYLGHESISTPAFGLLCNDSLTGNSTIQPLYAPAHNQPQEAVAEMQTSVSVCLATEIHGRGERRSRDLEFKFVQDLMCCDIRMNGMHDLLEQ